MLRLLLLNVLGVNMTGLKCGDKSTFAFPFESRISISSLDGLGFRSDEGNASQFFHDLRNYCAPRLKRRRTRQQRHARGPVCQEVI